LSQEADFSPKTIVVALRVDDVFMSDTGIQPQEIDSFLTVVESHGARLQLAVIPHRLLEPANAEGRMARDLRRFADRGHMVSLHGWNHRHAPTGDTGAEFQDPTTGGWIPLAAHLDQLRQGKKLLESITGKPVTAYVSPGSDDQLHPQNVRVIRELGICWLTHPAYPEPVFTDTLWYVPDATDYTWALEPASFAVAMDSAKAGFLRAAGQGRYFGIVFHDHFTRWGWREGIVARWLDGFLTWLASLPEYRVRYVTLDDVQPTDFTDK
jgi:peptidoglycan/xylan/chitin deacetylase (PgdA/CDA1 family)